MAEFIQGIIHVFSLYTFLLMIICTGWGLIGGAMPGISASMAVVLILPFTYSMRPIQAIVAMMAVYVGAACGGSISAILIRTPGTPEAVATTFDGYPLTLQGKAGTALGLAVTASSFGSIFSAIIMMFTAPMLAKVALRFQSAEYFALALLGLSCVSSIGSKHQGKAIVSALFGLLVATVGIDPINGVDRFTFKQGFLQSGIDFIPVIIGCFAITEIYKNLENYSKRDDTLATGDSKVTMKLLKFKEMFRMWWTFLRSAIVGTIIGILPAAGGTIGSLVSYALAVKSDKEPDRFGKGAYEGVIASEASNNAVVGGSMVPTLVLGIPGSGTAAIILAAFTIHGIRPGPLLIREQPDLLYAILISILLSSVLLFALGRFIAREFALILRLPYPILGALIMIMSIVGSYSLRGSYYDVVLTFVFSLIGYFFHKFNFSNASFILALVLGRIAETSFRRQMLVSKNNVMSFFVHPISAVIILISIGVFLSPYISQMWKRVKSKTT